MRFSSFDQISGSGDGGQPASSNPIRNLAAAEELCQQPYLEAKNEICQAAATSTMYYVVPLCTHVACYTLP